MKFVCSLITVVDMVRSRYFYEELLNQKVKFDFGENVSFEGGFTIHLRSHFGKLINNKEIQGGGNNFELYFEYDQVDEIVVKLHENFVVFIHEPREQPWRQKVVRFYDPDQNIIEIGETMEYLSYRLHLEGMHFDQIVKTINMTTEFVRESIDKFKTRLL